MQIYGLLSQCYNDFELIHMLNSFTWYVVQIESLI